MKNHKESTYAIPESFNFCLTLCDLIVNISTHKLQWYVLLRSLFRIKKQRKFFTYETSEMCHKCAINFQNWRYSTKKKPLLEPQILFELFEFTYVIWRIHDEIFKCNINLGHWTDTLFVIRYLYENLYWLEATLSRHY